MQDDPHGRADRLELIADMHRRHARWLERRVAHHAPGDLATIEDACSFAWMQLLTHPAVELGPRADGAIGWLMRTATREAWRLHARRAREQLLDQAAIEREMGRRRQSARSADDLPALLDRRELVEQIPVRARRFLMRLAIGHNYREIAAAENVSLTTTNKQIARAKRLLRSLELSAQAAR